MERARPTQRPAWQALSSHHEEVKDVHLRTLFAEDPQRGERMALEAAGLYLDYSKNRVTDETLRAAARSSPSERACASAIDAMFRGEQDQRHRGPRGAARRAARAARRLDRGRRRGRRAGGARACSTGWPTSPTACASGAWTGHTGKRDPQRRQHRHRRLRPRPGDGLRGAAALQPSRELTFRFVSNVDGTDFVEATRDLDPAETLFIVSSKTFTTLETLTNAHSARAWCARRARATRRRSPSTSSRSRPTPRRSRSSASTPPTCSSSGTGSAAATRIDSAIGLSLMVAIGPEHFREHARRLPRDGRALPHRAVRDATCRCCSACSASGTATSSAPRPSAVLPYSQYLGRLPGLPAAARHGEQRQVGRRSTAARVDYADRADRLGHSPAPTASTPSTS